MTLGVSFTSERRPKKNIRSSWHEWTCRWEMWGVRCGVWGVTQSRLEWTMWWNCPAVHGVWKSATDANASMRRDGVCTTTITSPVSR